MGTAREKLKLTLLSALCGFLGILADCCSCSGASEAVRLQGETMGTYYSVVVHGIAGSRQAEIQREVENCLADVNRQMSTWDANSEISRFNRQESTDWFSVSAEFARVVEESLRIHRLTHGAFDPTVSPLVDLWGFGNARPVKLPSDDQIAKAMQRVGMERIEVRTDPPAIRKTHATVTLNLSAIAKGHGVDRVSLLLKSLGFPSHIVDIGGENRAGELKPEGEKWRVGIESPLTSAGGLHRVIEIAGRSVATSGDYRNFFEIEGVRYSHVIDPQTGKPVANPPASVTVISDSCMTADALATALMVMGSGNGVSFAEKNGLSVLFLDVEEDGPSSARQVRESATGELMTGDAPAPQTEIRPVNGFDKWMPFIAAMVIFLLAVTGMSVGVLVRNRELKGSCGGLASMPGEDGRSACQLCAIPKEQCRNPERFTGQDRDSAGAET